MGGESRGRFFGTRGRAFGWLLLGSFEAVLRRRRPFAVAVAVAAAGRPLVFAVRGQILRLVCPLVDVPGLR